MKSHNIAFLAFLVIGSIVFAGCSSSSSSSNLRPEWVDQGSGFYRGDKSEAFYGVGVATGIQNVQLRRTAAGLNARIELARSLKSMLLALGQAYARHVSGGVPNISNEEQVVREMGEIFTDTTLYNVPITNFYYSESEQTLYALAVMDASVMKDQLTQIKKLSPQVQDAILKNSDEAFKELYKKRKENK